MKIKIVSDTTCDLCPELIEQNNISLVPLYIRFGDDTFKDGIDITQEKIYDYVSTYKELPKTAAANMHDFYEEFKKHLDNGYDYIIYTGISSQMSTTFNSANLAIDMLKEEGYDPSRIRTVDSGQLSTGTSHLLLQAAKRIEEGKTIDQVESDMLSRVSRLRTSFIVDTMQYLHMGGRCSSIQYVAGSLIKLHPQINVVEGRMIAGTKYRGSMDRCLKQYFENTIMKDKDNLDRDILFITTTATDEFAKEAYSYVKDLDLFDNIIFTRAGATITSHCGAGTLGYLYMVKENK